MEAEVRTEKLREDERILQAIDECISSKDAHYESNKAILKEILDDAFATIKGRDGFFREQYRGFFVENYYKGPKIGKPEEFEVYISIKMPLDDKLIKMKTGMLGNQMLEHCEDPSIRTPQLYKHWNRKNHRTTWDFNKDRFRHAITSLLAWAMLNIPRIDNYTIKVSEDGPAFNLCVQKQDLSEIKVNLMPVLEFDCKSPYSLKGAFKWYAVPDPLKDVEDQHLLWRLAFYNHENDLLTRHSYLTPAIRKLEKLLDAQGWTVISCYHIKDLFMHYARSMENDAGVPDTFKLTGMKLFIHMLDRLRNMCKTKRLQEVSIFEHKLIDSNESPPRERIGPYCGTTDNNDQRDYRRSYQVTLEELRMFQNELKAVGILQNTDCPSKSVQMSEGDKPRLSEDVRNPADGISTPVTDAVAASRDIESSLCTEAGIDTAGCPAVMDINGVMARLERLFETLSHRLTALEQKSTV